MKTVETLESQRTFTAVALLHGLIQSVHADQILEKAHKDRISESDAALQLSILNSQEVDAIQLLCKPDELAQGYQLTQIIGYGAAGIVLRAKQIALNRDVAIKTVSLRDRPSPTSAGRIQREAQAIARLNHPNIVSIYDSGIFQGRFCIILELVEGEDLGTRIDRQGPLGEGLALQIVRQIASALAHASEAGIIHRDIKPANILLTLSPSGTSLNPEIPLVKVADFGLALDADDGIHPNLTLAGTTLGSPSYVAPEQLKDSRVDHRADIYSLGATLFHMLQGIAPLSGQSLMKAIIGKSTGNDAWRNELSQGVSPGTEALFRNMTETDPAKRPSDYGSLIIRIDHLISELSAANSIQNLRSTKRIPELAPRFSIRMSLAIVAALSIISLTITGFVWSLFSESFNDVSSTSENFRGNVIGSSIPLFDGQSIPRFKQSGSWTIDSSFSLVGEAGSMLAFPIDTRRFATPNYRFRIGIDTGESGSMELAFPKPTRSSPQAPNGYAVAIFPGRATTVELARNASTQKQSTTPSRKPIEVELSTETFGEPTFHEVHVSRLADQLLVSVNGSNLGVFACDKDTEHTLEIRVLSGKVAFADIDYAEIAKVQTNK